MDIFAKGVINILEFLAERPLKSFYEKELSKYCKVSTGAVNAYMKVLKSYNLVKYEKKGKSTLYRINMENFVAREIKSLFTLLKLQELVYELKPLSKKIIVFGSCATGTDVEESDIDLFILSSEDKKKLLGMFSKFEKKIGKKVSPIIVNPSELNGLMGQPIYKNIIKGKVLWYEDEYRI